MINDRGMPVKTNCSYKTYLSINTVIVMNLVCKRLGIAAIVWMCTLAACKKDELPKGPVPADDYIESKPPAQSGVAVKINNAIGGFYQALPSYYGETTKKYPLLISLHGGGQTGNGNTNLPYLLNDGVAKMISQQKFPANFVVNGKNYSFIVLTPQFSRYPGEEEVESFIQYAKKRYRIDASRVYITGLSLGGYVASDMGAKYPSELAAIVPMSGVSVSGDLKAKAASIAKGNLPTWYFSNSDDPSIGLYNFTNFIALLNSNAPVTAPRHTVFNQYGHDSWSKALDSNYKENGKNVFEWMLQYSR